MPDVPFGLEPPTGVVPYLAVHPAAEAVDWYTRALGAGEQPGRMTEPEGTIGHVAMVVHGQTFFLSDGAAALGVEPPAPEAAVAFSLVLTVPDVDEAIRHAVDEGARLEREPEDAPYGRIGVIRDPYGHRWMLEQPPS